MDALDFIFRNIGFIITTALTLAGIIVAMVKIWQKWSLRLAQYKESTIKQIATMSQKVNDNQKRMSEHHDATTLEIEKMRLERERIVEGINNRIQNLEKKHEDDVNSLQSAIEKAFAKIYTENRDDHGKIFDKLDNLSEQVVSVCATFKEYKENQKIITPRKK